MDPIRRHALALAAALLLAAAGAAQAFGWEPFAFEPRDQAYTIEVVQGNDVPTSTIEIDVVAQGDGFDVTTTMTTEQTGVAIDELDGALFGGGSFAMLAMGPTMLFGPAAMMVPALVGQEDIRVREEPIRVMGYGTLHMEREVEVAGRTCVVLRFEVDEQPDAGFEFAVADGVPIPCFSRFGSGDDAVEIRLTRIE